MADTPQMTIDRVTDLTDIDIVTWTSLTIVFSFSMGGCRKGV